MTPPRRPRGLFTEITEGVYWFVVVDVMIVLAAAVDCQPVWSRWVVIVTCFWSVG